MTQERLTIPGNDFTGAKHDENRNVVSVCCEAELEMTPRARNLNERMKGRLASDAISWQCSGCKAVVLGVETTRVPIEGGN